MFESVRQDVRPNAMSYFVSLLLSIVTHAVILGVAVTIPLIFYSPLNAYSPVTWLIDSPVLSKKAPPPPPPSRSTAATKPSAGTDGIIYKGPLVPPEKIPAGVPPPIDLPGLAGFNRLGPGDGWSGVGITGQTPPAGDWMADLLNKPVPELPPPEPPAKSELVHVVSELQESKLIFKVNPVYPEMAVRARVSGAVVLAAIIDEEGSVTNLKVLSGHPLLTKAALEAVRQWKYRPTILNGEPVTVSAVVTIVFKIQ